MTVRPSSADRWRPRRVGWSGGLGRGGVPPGKNKTLQCTLKATHRRHSHTLWSLDAIGGGGYGTSPFRTSLSPPVDGGGAEGLVPGGGRRVRRQEGHPDGVDRTVEGTPPPHHPGVRGGGLGSIGRLKTP